MNPESESRIIAFVALFFDGKESARLIHETSLLTDHEITEIIACIDQYEEAHRKFREIEHDFFSIQPISEQDLARLFGDDENCIGLSKEEQERTFDAALDSLLEQLIDNSKTPLAVKTLAMSDKLSVAESIEKIDALLGKAKRAHFARELPKNAIISNEVREIKRRKIFEHNNVLRKNLVDSMENFPNLWGQGQEAIAHLEPINELKLLFLSWDRESELSILSQKLRQCSAYKALHRYAHPLLELITLSELLELDELDFEAIDQALWTFVKGMGLPGAQTISDRLSYPRQRLYSRLAGYLENIFQNKGSSLTNKGRNRLYCALELLVSAVPSNANISLRVQDLAWRSVLLSKAGEYRRSGDLANEAINLAREIKSQIVNWYLWWTRLGDANFNAAFSSGDPLHDGWWRGVEFYNKALEVAYDDNKAMIYFRQARAVADRLELYESKMLQGDVKNFLELANEGVRLANKSYSHSYKSDTAVFIRARIEEVWARNAKTVDLGDASALEEKFHDSIREILSLNPCHTGAIRIAFNFMAKSGDFVGAIDWLDQRITSLRGSIISSNQKLADYLEFRAAEHSLDFGLEDEARERLIRIVKVTQPGNSEAWSLLSQLGFRTPQESDAQRLYTEAMQCIPGSAERKELTKSALLSNESLIDLDPRMTDVVPWTRQARLWLFMDDFVAAIKILEELQSKFPLDPYVQFHLGEAYYRQRTQASALPTGDDSNENFHKATDAFERAWELKPRVDTAHRLSACWFRKGNVNMQKYWLDRAEELDAFDGWTKLSLGWSVYNSGDVRTAFFHWVEAVQCLSTESQSSDRKQWLAYIAARSVVRYGQVCRNKELNLEQLNPNAIRLIASAACGAGWRYPAVIESFGRFLDKIPALGLRRIPHAVRAHLLFLQLAGGQEFAHQWHNRWYDNFRALEDRSLFIEYLAGGKSVFLRAASWSIQETGWAELYEVPRKQDFRVDWTRWGAFIQIASGWGKQKDYYRNVYSNFPTGAVECEELYLVLQTINAMLFRRAKEALGFDKARTDGLQIPTILSSLPIEPEILPATEIDPNAPECVLVHTDELHSRILLDSGVEFIDNSRIDGFRKRWNLSGDRLCCSFNYDDDRASLHFNSLRSSAFRNGNQIIMNRDGGVDVCIPLWE